MSRFFGRESPGAGPAPGSRAADATEPLVGSGERPSARAKLVVLAGPNEGLERALTHAVRVGSDAASDLCLDDRGVSRAHATFFVRDGSVWVRDDGSRNGTFFQGSQVREAELPLGAVVTLGATPVAIYPRWHVQEVPPSRADRFGRLYGASLAMRAVFAVLERVAPTDTTVLIEGESGTGKELAARSLHDASGRADKPYVVVDCTTIAKELAESELFGHRRGAFSGAVADRSGAFQQADGGTIFLDELGELPLDVQPKLLRVLEAGEVRRVGDSAHAPINVRIVAATNRNLDAEARRGRFREDLLYRLGVVRVRLPPLRLRPEDIAGIAALLLDGRLEPGDRVAGEPLQQLIRYSWPGNVRELRNVLERAWALAPRHGGRVRFEELIFNLASNRTEPATLGFSFPGVDSPLPYKEAKAQLLAQFDDEYVQALMRRHDGNVSRAAREAGISRKHLYELLRRVEEDDSPP